MVWHDDPCVEMIARTVSGDESCLQNCCALRTCQQAVAVSGIQQRMKARGELPVISVVVVIRQILRGRHAPFLEPRGAFPLPLFGDARRDGIRQP